MAPDTSSGAADRSGSGEAGRPDDSWRQVETEQADRDRAARAHDASHDPSPEFEYAVRPLDNDYGRDRPRDRALTPEQRAELAEVFDRPADELLALRENDPRAGHNRDEQGRILDQAGNPRPERTPEQMLGEAERQARLYGPEASAEAKQPPDRGQSDTSDPRTPFDPTEHATATGQATADRSQREPRTEDSPDLQAPSDAPGDNDAAGGDSEAHQSSDGGDSGGGDASSGGKDRGGNSDDGGEDGGGEDGGGESDDQPESNQPEDLAKVVTEVDTDLRSGKLTVSEAANRLEQVRDSRPPAASEPTTDTERTEQTPDGERRFQRETPVETADATGERIATDQSDKVSRAQRNSNEYKRAAEAVPDFENAAEKINALLDHRLPSGAHGETTTRQPDMPAIETRHTGDVDPGNVIAACLAATVASVVYLQRLRDKMSSKSN